jgi:hypothetical protein
MATLLLTRGATAAALAATVGIAACRDEARMLTPGQPRGHPALAETRSEPVWNRFSADVVVTLPGISLTASGGQTRVREVSFHVDEARDASGHWRTTYSSIRTSVPSGQVGQESARLRASRVEIDELGELSLFDTLGEKIDLARRLPSTDSLSRQLTGSSMGRSVLSALKARRSYQLPARGAVKPSSGTRQWHSGFVFDVAQQQAALSTLRVGRAPSGAEGRGLRFSLASERGTIEVVIDSVTGNVIRVNRQPDQGPATHTSYEHTQLGNGQYARTLVRQERDADGPRPAMMSETRVTGARLDTGRSQ